MPGMDVPGNFILIGLMGAGKTTVGKALAKQTGKTFYDSDHEVEARAGVRIPLIFDIEGEAGFRLREAETILEILKEDNIVLATGGGAVLNPTTRQLLSENGVVVYLRATVDELYQRTRHDKNRPLLQTANPRARLEKLYSERDALYTSTAHLIVDTGRQGVMNLTQQILRDIARYHANRTC